MKDSNKRLGKGLSSLISSPGPSRLASQLEGDLTSQRGLARAAAIAIPVQSIKPNARQPRRNISEAGIRGLAESIKRNGLIQPIVVRPLRVTTADDEVTQTSVKYELIAGERRWRAAREAGLSDVPGIIREADDSQLLELALVENIQREDLNAIDRALAYRQFKERFGLSPEEVGKRVGEDRTTVTNYLRLLELPEVIREMVAGDLISMGHARALLAVQDEHIQLELARSVVTDQLSVRALEDTVRRRRTTDSPSSTSPAKKKPAKRPHIRDLEQIFMHRLQTRVAIQEGRKKNKGKITIEYNSLDDFDRICEILGVKT